jgi:fatty acid desaturase
MTGVMRSDVRTAFVVLLHVSFTYFPVFLTAALPLSGWTLLFWLWFGFTKNGLINLMHECAHKLCFRSARANEVLGGWILAPLVLAQFDEYRERHWDHHRNLGTPGDPKIVYRTNVRGWKAFGLIARCLLGVEAVRRLTEKPSEPSVSRGPKHSTLSSRFVCVHLLFFGCLTIVALSFQGTLGRAILSVGVAYGFVYGYGLSSITVLAAAIRAIAEHQIGSDQSIREGAAALRNFRCNFLTRLLFGAYGFTDHATHHRRPDVPYYQLPALTATLSVTDSALMARSGYLATFVRLVFERTGKRGLVFPSE